MFPTLASNVPTHSNECIHHVTTLVIMYWITTDWVCRVILILFPVQEFHKTGGIYPKILPLLNNGINQNILCRLSKMKLLWTSSLVVAVVLICVLSEGEGATLKERQLHLPATRESSNGMSQRSSLGDSRTPLTRDNACPNGKCTKVSRDLQHGFQWFINVRNLDAVP